MVAVVSPHLVAVDAAWDDGPDAGRWIEGRLGPFGPSVGHAVPLGYPAYAVVPIPRDDLESDRGSLPSIDALLDVLGSFTGDQPVHSGMWEGWSWWYTNEIAIAGTTPVIDAVLDDPRLNAHRATPEDILDGDD